MSGLKYSAGDLGEPDDALRVGIRLGGLSARLHDVGQMALNIMYPSYVPDSSAYLRDGARHARQEAERYMDEARELAARYSSSVVVREHLGCMEAELNRILKKTTDEEIESSVREVFGTAVA